MIDCAAVPSRSLAVRCVAGWTYVWLVATLLVLGAPVAAQDAPDASAETTRTDSCSVWLAEAQMRYTEQDYIGVESLVLQCAYHPDALPGHLLHGYRLLTLAFIRQDLLHEAQTTVLKILAVDFGYEPDPVQDPPFYVALVGSVKDQLRVQPTARPAARTAPSAGAPAVSARINPNTATPAELETVPGIGPVIAGRIVAYRTQNGPFQRLEDLQNVSGIGPRTLERLAPHLVLEGGAQSFRAAGGVPGAAAPPPAAARPAVVPAGARINLNTATAAELESLNGIGPALAGRIIAYREQVGPFQRVEDVLGVRGIGPRTLERFIDAVTVGPTSGD